MNWKVIVAIVAIGTVLLAYYTASGALNAPLRALLILVAAVAFLLGLVSFPLFVWTWVGVFIYGNFFASKPAAKS